MKEQKRLEHLHCTFLRLTEINQIYMIGLVEGLMYAQDVSRKATLVKIPVDSQESKSVFYSRSDERKTCS